MPAKLDPYRAKRRFNRTAEPKGGKPAASGPEPIFVIQKHRARRLHYDLRLEIGGTLKSWAVPQGPCLDPAVKRLAAHVEDHPMEYASFEGRIPDGEYGAGAVIVWDRGAWICLEDDPQAALEAGAIKFRLAGEKLHGGWMLTRLARDPKNWLLIKERDVEARPLAEFDVLAAEPRSVMSGLTVEDLDAKPAKAKPPRKTDPARAPGARPGALPERFSPQLATPVAAPVEGEGWIHELKYDGYRTLCRIDNGAIKFITRKGLDWTQRYGRLAEAFKKLACKTALIDGEVVVQDARGRSSIHLLENALSENRSGDLTFYAFDIVHLDGFDLTSTPLDERAKVLRALIEPVVDARSALQISDHFTGDGAALFAEACRLGLEGIISKRASSRYVQARTAAWVKLKRHEVGEFIIVGFTTNGPRRIAALLLADGEGELAYVGKVGSGISDARGAELYALLSPAAVPTPVVEAPRERTTTFIAPAYIAKVEHRGRTLTGAVRQTVLLGVGPRQTLKPRLSPKKKLVNDRDLAAIRLTNPDREMFAPSGVTKLDLAVYYARVGDWMLPDLLNRPVTLVRCPTGALEDCFYQRHVFNGLPEGVRAIDLSDEEGRHAFVYIADAKGFLGLLQFGVIEFHPWPCLVDDPDHPDRLIIDLDPDPALPWTQVAAAAETLAERLRSCAMTPFLRTTGGKGLHLVVPLRRTHEWPVMKGFAQAFAAAMAKDSPRLFTNTSNKERRVGRIYLDFLRNARGATAVGGYSLRANREFTVATPIGWEELRDLPNGRVFDRKTVPARLERLGKDPWEGLHSAAATISKQAQRDVGMK